MSEKFDQNPHHHHDHQHNIKCFCSSSEVSRDHLFSTDTLTIIASFLQVSDWFSMNGVNQCWSEAIHYGMKHVWRRLFSNKGWMLDKIVGVDKAIREVQENNLLGNSQVDCVLKIIKENMDEKDDDGDSWGIDGEEVDWMRLIQFQILKLPIKIETVERGECLDFCEDRRRRMEWESPLLNQKKGDLKNSFSIFQYSFNVLKKVRKAIGNGTSLDENLEQVQQELFKQYRICLFLEYLSLGLRPNMISDIVYVWEDIYDTEPILSMPLVSFLLLLLTENPIDLMEDLIQEESGEVSNWIYISLSTCPQHRIGFSFIIRELDVSNYSQDWNGTLPWYHQTDINEKNFPLYLGFSQHLYDDDSTYSSDEEEAIADCCSPCRLYHLSISCELLETHYIKLYREETTIKY